MFLLIVTSYIFTISKWMGFYKIWWRIKSIYCLSLITTRYRSPQHCQKEIIELYIPVSRVLKTQFYNILSSQLNPDTKELFDCVWTFIVFNNSAKAQICKGKRYFSGEILPVNPISGIAKIRGNHFRPSCIGTVKWDWWDNDWIKYKFTFKNILYFPDSLVNILSITALADGLIDNEGTWIQTKRKISVLKWNKETFVQHFGNSAARLPEL